MQCTALETGVQLWLTEGGCERCRNEGGPEALLIQDSLSFVQRVSFHFELLDDGQRQCFQNSSY